MRDALRSSAVEVLAANLPRKARNAWGAAPYTVVETPRFSVGIIGMLGTVKTDFQPGFRPQVPEGSPPLEDYRQSLERAVKKLRGRCSVLIVLAQADMGKAMELLQALPQVDVMISSTEAHLGREPITVGRSVMVFGGTEGQRLGHLHLKVYPNRSVGVVWGRSVRLTEKIDEDPDVRELVQRTTARANAWHRERAEAALAAAQGAGGYRGAYRTASACRECHEAAHEVWRTSAHARAMCVLEAGNQDFLPQCVSCHVTGMGSGGFRDRLSTPELADVQCEACHGPAAEHLEDPARPYGPAGLETCAETCHTPDQTAGHFAPGEAWERIRH